MGRISTQIIAREPKRRIGSIESLIRQRESSC